MLNVIVIGRYNRDANGNHFALTRMATIEETDNKDTGEEVREP
jgi:hypothetical protein